MPHDLVTPSGNRERATILRMTVQLLLLPKKTMKSLKNHIPYAPGALD